MTLARLNIWIKNREKMKQHELVHYLDITQRNSKIKRWRKIIESFSGIISKLCW
jgi:hypothetical protein